MRNRREALTILGLSVLATPARAAAVASGFGAVHQSEPFLLHRQIGPSYFTKLSVWDLRLSEWRAMQPEESFGERSAVYVLHLWADYCAPCREEFPILRELTEETDKKYGASVRWVFLSETSSPVAMQAFLAKYQARMPKGPQYLDTGEAIANLLSEGLNSSLSYPVTLLLDAQRVVRHAFVGRVRGRRTEFMNTLDRLLAIPR